MEQDNNDILSDFWDQYFNQKQCIVYVVTDWIDTGFRLARALGDAKSIALAVLGGGKPLIHNAIGCDPTWLFLDGARKPYPKHALFVFPEHHLVPKQQREFFDLLLKVEHIEQITIITANPIIISDFPDTHVKIVTADSFTEPENLPGLLVL